MSNNFSILVIDDESQIRKLLEITLEANGYKLLFAVAETPVNVNVAAVTFE